MCNLTLTLWYILPSWRCENSNGLIQCLALNYYLGIEKGCRDQIVNMSVWILGTCRVCDMGLLPAFHNMYVWRYDSLLMKG